MEGLGAKPCLALRPSGAHGNQGWNLSFILDPRSLGLQAKAPGPGVAEPCPVGTLAGWRLVLVGAPLWLQVAASCPGDLLEGARGRCGGKAERRWGGPPECRGESLEGAKWRQLQVGWGGQLCGHWVLPIRPCRVQGTRDPLGCAFYPSPPSEPRATGEAAGAWAGRSSGLGLLSADRGHVMSGLACGLRNGDAGSHGQGCWGNSRNGRVRGSQEATSQGVCRGIESPAGFGGSKDCHASLVGSRVVGVRAALRWEGQWLLRSGTQ